MTPHSDLDERRQVVATTPKLIDRRAIEGEYERVRQTFHRLLQSATEGDLQRQTAGTNWNNEQLLFHMLFGFLVIRAVLALMHVFARLPDGFNRIFAALLNAGTGPFNVVNYAGSCIGVRVFNHRRMGRKFDKAVAILVKRMNDEPEEHLDAGIHFPTRWDPYFRGYMTLAEVYLYPTQHFTFHQRQLTLDQCPFAHVP